jgi:hypothetical protein
MCCRLYFERIVPTILDYLSAGVEMPTLPGRAMRSFFSRLDDCVLRPESIGGIL